MNALVRVFRGIYVFVPLEQRQGSGDAGSYGKLQLVLYDTA